MVAFPGVRLNGAFDASRHALALPHQKLVGRPAFARPARRFAQGRIQPDETTVLCITGNGLKTTDALAGRFTASEPIAPKLAAFEEYLEREPAASVKGAA